MSLPHLDLRGALGVAGIDARDLDTAEPVAGEHRNQTWLLRFTGDPWELVLKIQSDLAGYPTVRHEAAVLALLQRVACVPRLRSSGVGGDPERAFLITERLPGEPLDAILERGVLPGDSRLADLAEWLYRFSLTKGAWSFLAARARDFLGPWAIDYSPGSDPWHHANRIGLVHGSFDPGNILVGGDTSDLCGVVDYEATRLGSPLIDVAGLALHFLIRRRADLAWRWLCSAAEVWRWPSLPRQAMPYLVDQHQRRANVGTVPNAPEWLVRDLSARCDSCG